MSNISSEEMPLISVIIPVYNVEKYIDKCINSVIKQSYENIEIILVDDGSKDNSGRICDDYKLQYDNIRVVHKNNAGLGYARNTGLDIMNGDYVTFIDSDDWVSCDLVYDLYYALKSNNVDFCKSGFKRVKHNGEIIVVSQYKNEIYNGREAALKLLPKMIGSSPDEHDSLEMCVCGVLYNADIIRKNNVRFPSERVLISEDMVFNIDYMQYANGACSIDSVNYFYRMNEKSLSHSYRSDRFEVSVFFYKEMREKLEKLGYDNSTILRLDRMFFIFIRMSIGQEKRSISGHNRNDSINIIKKMCEDNTVKEAVFEYPINKLGYKQKFFLKLIINKRVRILYFLSNFGVI